MALSQRRLAFFLLENPPPFFTGTAGVLAGTVVRRWNENGGGRRWGPVFPGYWCCVLLVLLLVELRRRLLDSRLICEMWMLRSLVVLRLRRSLIWAVRSVYLVQAPSRSDPKCGQREVANVPRGAAAQFGGAVAVPSGGGHELPAAENTFFERYAVLWCRGYAFWTCFAVLAVLVFVRVDARHPSRDALVAQRHHSGGGQRHGRRAVSGAVAGSGQQARCERAEAGSCPDSDVLLSVRVENPSARVARVNTALHLNSHSTPARSLHDVHVARCVQNSLNSLGGGVVRGRGVCVLGGTKSPSMSTRSGGQAFLLCNGSAHIQQTPLKLHAETWEGLFA